MNKEDQTEQAAKHNLPVEVEKSDNASASKLSTPKNSNWNRNGACFGLLNTERFRASGDLLVFVGRGTGID